MNHLRTIWGLIFFFGVVLSAWSQEEQYKFSNIDVNHGLSHNQIKCFLRDSRGHMWFGTISGLNRFDGYTIKTFRNIPGDDSSISNSDVNSLFEDPDGNIWMSTWTGVDVYNPGTETFSHDPNIFLRKLSIPDGSISDIKKDQKGNFWFVHTTQGLFKYEVENKRTTPLYYNPLDTTSLASNQISSIAEDSKGNFWIIHRNGIFEKLDGSTLTVAYRNDYLNKLLRQRVYDYRLMVDASDDVWLFIADKNEGAFYFNSNEQSLTRINRASQETKLNSDIVKGIVQDNKGLIWIATDHGGINLIDKTNFSARYITSDPDDRRSLSHNSINSLYKDDEGIIWIGTFKRGISFYHENIIRFRLYRHQTTDPSSLPFNDINAIVEDSKRNLWIGTNGGGLIYWDRAKKTFTQFTHDPKKPNSLSNNVIVSLFLDSYDKLWIGTYYGGLNCYDGKNFIRYKHDASDPKSISDDSIWEIFEDSNKNLWIGTLTQGVDVFNRERQEFYHYREGDPNSIHSKYISAFMEDSQGNIWIGTGYGIDVLDKKTNLFKHYLNEIGDHKSLSNNSVLSMYEDSRGLIWIGTHGGLNLFDRATNTFKVFNEENGLLHNSVLTLVESDDGNLWASTPHGISNIIVTYKPDVRAFSLSFKNYNESDGLQGRQFNENAALKTSAGEIVFAGINGFNIFHPEEIQINKVKPRVNLSDFQIFNKSVGIGESVNNKVILKKSISETDEIILKYNDNVFSIEFVALNFFHPEKSEYKYKLDGFNKDWLTTDGKQRKVTYTNLDPGTYTFYVQASNSDGIWNEEGAKLQISILPPFWRSGIAFIIYIAVILGALLLSRQLILARERLKYKIEKERQDAQQLHELDMMKIKFITNVSHEFRTPLSLILTPLEKLLKGAVDSEHRKQYLMIHRNARRLLNLVNQLLDFRRLEVQEVKLNLSEGDIVSFVRDAAYSFTDLSEKKHIDFSFHTDLIALEAMFDKDKLEKILFNLLSNAFKFTPLEGRVEVNMSLLEKTEEKTKWIAIRVKDSGIGIPHDKHERIFERFFQNDVPASMVNQGSGIGLSITKEFVKLHGGIITVESEPNAGSCFTVLLPLADIKVNALQPATIKEGQALEDAELISRNGHVNHKVPVLLLVEDNEDFRFYLKDNLKLNYQIIEAGNGKEGLQLAIKYLPDLIVSDIMMPEMDGIELCKRVKANQAISHTPIILLTARTNEEQKMQGFEIGADDYITKPFNFEILQSRIKNLIHQREIFHKDFRKQIEVKATDIKITSMDEKLIQNAIKFVEDNIAEADFSVEDLSRELGMSRVHLYKKLLALTGKAPLEFIRTIRLQRAAQLLEKSQLTISEVAYKVGFNSPKYFAKYFKDEFGMLPSAYLQSKKKDPSAAK
jgi:signal transduction histidine kinase/ligand-binding sensor domain-containing protein/DNA-binding response OmpR family regulator